MSAESEIEVLANYIMAEIPGEPSQDAGAGTTAVRILHEYSAKVAALEKDNAELKNQIIDLGAEGEGMKKEANSKADLGKTIQVYQMAWRDSKIKVAALEKELAEAITKNSALAAILMETGGDADKVQAELARMKPELKRLRAVADAAGRLTHEHEKPKYTDTVKSPMDVNVDAWLDLCKAFDALETQP